GRWRFRLLFAGVGFFRSSFGGRRLGFGGRSFGLDRGFHRSLFHGRLFDGRRGGGGFSGGGGAVGLALDALLGAFFGLGARLALLRVAAGLPLRQALLGELTRHAVGGLGALLHPLLDPLDLQDHAVRVVLL